MSSHPFGGGYPYPLALSRVLAVLVLQAQLVGLLAVITRQLCVTAMLVYRTVRDVGWPRARCCSPPSPLPPPPPPRRVHAGRALCRRHAAAAAAAPSPPQQQQQQGEVLPHPRS